MVQILERPESTGQRLAKSIHGIASQGIPMVAQQLMQRQGAQSENEAIQRLTGQDFSGLPPELKQMVLKEFLGRQGKESEMRQKLQGEKAPLEAGLKTIGRQRELLKSGFLGSKAHPGVLLGMATPKGRAVRSEYEQLGKSLISLASNIPIRNQREFETLAERLYDPSMTEADIKGTLDAMERVIRQNLGEDEIGAMGMEEEAPRAKKKAGMSTFQKDLKSATMHRGKRAVDEETGKIYRSNGKEWIEE